MEQQKILSDWIERKLNRILCLYPGIKDITYLVQMYEKQLGKSSVNGYGIRF